MFPVSTTQNGQCFGFPDVCKTPAAPSPITLPYPNVGMCLQAIKASNKVKVCQRQVITKKSEIPRSSGDEPGTLGGVVSNRFMDKVIYRKGSSKVKIEGQECIYLLAPTGHNAKNANMPAGMQIVPSQVKVLVQP